MPRRDSIDLRGAAKVTNGCVSGATSLHKTIANALGVNCIGTEILDMYVAELERR